MWDRMGLEGTSCENGSGVRVREHLVQPEIERELSGKVERQAQGCVSLWPRRGTVDSSIRVQS